MDERRRKEGKGLGGKSLMEIWKKIQLNRRRRKIQGSNDSLPKATNWKERRAATSLVRKQQEKKGRKDVVSGTRKAVEFNAHK